jgi:hypothetical protein
MLSFKGLRSAILAVPVLTAVLLTACGSKEEVKDYTSTACPSSESAALPKNVASLASGYYMFNDAAKQPSSAQIKMNGQYATGKTATTFDAFSFPMRERLEATGENPSEIKIATVVQMPITTEKNQSFKFSHPCQINNALSENENEGLRIEPTQGTLYVLSGSEAFILLLDGSLQPPEHLMVKIQLLNPQNGKIEEVIFNLNEVVMVMNNPLPTKLDRSWQISDSNPNDTVGKWRLVRNMHLTRSYQTYYFYAVVKEEKGKIIRPKIQNIEFGAESIK